MHQGVRSFSWVPLASPPGLLPVMPSPASTFSTTCLMSATTFSPAFSNACVTSSPAVLGGLWKLSSSSASAASRSSAGPCKRRKVSRWIGASGSDSRAGRAFRNHTLHVRRARMHPASLCPTTRKQLTGM